MNLKVGSRRALLTLMSVSLLLVMMPVDRAAAVLQGCTVNASPSTVMVNNDTSFSFAITNTSTSSIEWVDIAAPGGGYFTVESGSANRWTANVTSGDVSFTNWALTPGRSQTFTVRAFPNAPSGNMNWNVQASDDPGGASAIGCSGNTGIVITGPPIQVSNVQATNITDSSATITWDTNDPGTSQVNYGLDSSYGSSTPQDNSLVTSHSVALTGLDADTAYHFQAVSNAAANSSTDSSADNTFLTSMTPSSGGGGGGGSGGSTSPLPSRGIPILSHPVESTPPTVSITSQVPAVGKVEPTVSGVAADNVAVADVEFSTDGGANWLPVQQVSGLGTQNVSFSFQPVHLADGLYKLIVRATNTSGLTATTPVITFGMDRVNPAIGGNVVALGPQMMQPDGSGTVTTMTGVDQKITLSTIGGTTSMVINATNTQHPDQSQIFYMTKIDGNGLWSGIVSFTHPGTYHMVANDTDAAGVVVSRTLNDYYVLPAATTVDAGNGHPVAANVKIYYYDNDSNSWVAWDASSFGQTNPVRTGKQGSFGLFLPAGKYYMTARAAGYRALNSSIFTLKQTTPVSAVLRLHKHHQLNLGLFHLSLDLPSFGDQAIQVDYAVLKSAANSKQSSLVGQPAPDFSVGATNGQTVNATDLLSKPTVISFEATWLPTAAEQIKALAQLQADPDLNVEPVAVQQSPAVAQAYANIAGLNLNWLIDPNGDLAKTYGAQSLPANYFVDRNGIIKKVVIGAMSKQQMLDDLAGL